MFGRQSMIIWMISISWIFAWSVLGIAEDSCIPEPCQVHCREKNPESLNKPYTEVLGICHNPRTKCACYIVDHDKNDDGLHNVRRGNE